MEPMVKLLVQSAFVVDGEIRVPGTRVEVPRSDAASLVHRGKAVVIDDAIEQGPQVIDAPGDEPPILTEAVEADDEQPIPAEAAEADEPQAKRAKPREKRA